MNPQTLSVIVISIALIIILGMIIQDATPSDYKIVEKDGKFIVKGRVLFFWKTAKGYGGFPYQFFKAIYDNKEDAQSFINRRK